jgi:hypothetical protein
MPKKIHDKVDDLLNSPSFYPEKSDKEREELAWPIATNIVKESSFNLKRFTYAQADEILKSSGIKDFATKFQQFTTKYPGMTSEKAFQLYISLNPQYFGKKLSGYPAFRLLATKFKEQQKAFTSDEIEQALTLIQSADASNFAYNEELNKEPLNADTSSAPAADLTNQPQGITGETVANNFPGQEKATGNYGNPGIQNFTQYTSQSAANAPKTKEQIDASERMFMMDNMNALRILSRNIFDVNALRNFEKDLTLSKNHIGTRFQGPVNNLLGKYGELASTPDSDRRTKNKLGAEIQYIIQNQLLGSRVRPSVVFNALQNPNQRTDYLYSGSKPPTPYQFRYVEDVYFDMKNELTTKFNEDRKAFAEQYIKSDSEAAALYNATNLPENYYPDELKQVAKPGSPIHQRAWMENNQKSVLQKAFGAEQADGSAQEASTGVRPKLVGPRTDGLKLPETIKPGDARLGPNKVNISPNSRPTFNYNDLKSSPPAPPAP